MEQESSCNFSILSGLSILQVYDTADAEPAHRAIRFASRLAQKHGAELSVQGLAKVPDLAFYSVTETDWPADRSFANGVTIRTCAPGHSTPAETPTVWLEMRPRETEATLFATSGLAELHGDPDQPPSIPDAHIAAHSIGYAVHAALVAMHLQMKMYGSADSVVVNAISALSWVNWKAGSLGAEGRNLRRQGAMAEWPVLPCQDGHVAFLFTEKDWPSIVSMIGAPELQDPRFATFKGREAHRTDYMRHIRRWAAQRTKTQIQSAFRDHALPGMPVFSVQDVIEDPLLRHRQAFERVGQAVVPRPAERVLAHAQARDASSRPTSGGCDLPLLGIRVLDLGIVTAGAGVGALLADLGAEVLKIEGTTYPDPFRSWAGEDDSPFFRFNNRNKFGLALDLKSKSGKQTFLDMVATADVVLENFRRGVIQRLGLGFDTLSAVNPALILGSISGQGHDGPGTGDTTFGSSLEANSGYAALTRDASGQPYITGRALNYPDQIVCLYGSAVIAGAVGVAQMSGRGCHVDISQRDCCLYQIGEVVERAAARMDAGKPRASDFASSGFDGFVNCADGRAVAIGAPSAADVASLKGAAQDLQDWAAQLTSEQALTEAAKTGAIAALSNTGTDMMTTPEIAKGHAFALSPDGLLVKGFPFQFLNTKMAIRLGSPEHGQHNLDFGLKELAK